MVYDQGVDDAPEPAPEQAFAAALAALKEAYDDAVTYLRAIPDPQRAFEAASELADMLREKAERASDERAFGAERIKERERLTLTALAERISVSKQRAGQIIQRADKARRKPEGR